MNKLPRALFPGTFDPPSLGHQDLIKRASLMFETLYIGIGENPDKPQHFFDTEEKKALLAKISEGIANVEILSFSGLVVDFAKKLDVKILVRGLRVGSDFDYEMRMAAANRKMTGIDTIFLISDPQFNPICSSIIHEIGRFGHRLHGFVPEVIEDTVYRRLFRTTERGLEGN